MIDVNKNEIMVSEGTDTFTFRIPSLRDEGRISSTAQALILQDSPDAMVKEDMLDDVGRLTYRTLATFKVLLKSSSAKWAYIDDPVTKGPIPNPNLPPVAVSVYLKYLEESQKFFQGGATIEQPPSGTTVDHI